MATRNSSRGVTSGRVTKKQIRSTSRSRSGEPSAHQPAWYASQASAVTKDLSVPGFRLASMYAKFRYKQASGVETESQNALNNLFFHEAMEKQNEAEALTETGTEAAAEVAIEAGTGDDARVSHSH